MILEVTSRGIDVGDPDTGGVIHTVTARTARDPAAMRDLRRDPRCWSGWKPVLRWTPAGSGAGDRPAGVVLAGPGGPVNAVRRTRRLTSRGRVNGAVFGDPQDRRRPGVGWGFGWGLYGDADWRRGGSGGGGRERRRCWRPGRRTAAHAEEVYLRRLRISWPVWVAAMEDIPRDGDCFWRSVYRAMDRFGGYDYLVEHVLGGWNVREPSFGWSEGAAPAAEAVGGDSAPAGLGGGPVAG